MFPWYQRATTCFAYLTDLFLDMPFSLGIHSCRWSTRGWTLQELIAPGCVQFFDKTWTERGSKADSWESLWSLTGIPGEVLRIESVVAEYSAAQRMSWASRRVTTRTEDTAYCLLCLFDVNIPLLYGESWKAFRRLQEEIVRHNNDTTIFARNTDTCMLAQEFCGIFAPSPATVSESGEFAPWPLFQYNPEFLITNKVLRVEDFICISPQRYFIQFLGFSEGS